MENRDKFEHRAHQLEKELKCPRCQHSFKVRKQLKTTFGPLWGHDPEVDK
jgi:hypothetical protein